MKILLVADQPHVLAGIDSIGLQFANDWHISCARLGSEALERLDAERFDVIIADLWLPGGDGIALLDEVRRRHPDVVRLILCAPDQAQAAMRAARVAHQFLAKPCSAGELATVVQRTLALQQLLEDEHIRAAIGALDGLPAAPRVFTELTQALTSEDSTTDGITHIVEQDPAISAKLLQVVNSALFSRGSPVHDLRGAVVRLGMRTIRDLALGVEVFVAQRVALPHHLTLEDLQEKALRTAMLASRIAGPADAGEAFLAGLLADVGLLAMAVAAPGILARACAVAAASGTRLHDAERSFHDVTHAEIGAYVLGTWGLPYHIVEAVANHHAPRRIAKGGLGVPASVYLAMALIEDDVLDPEYVGSIGTDADVARWRACAAELAVPRGRERPRRARLPDADPPSAPGRPARG